MKPWSPPWAKLRCWQEVTIDFPGNSIVTPPSPGSVEPVGGSLMSQQNIPDNNIITSDDLSLNELKFVVTR